MRAIIADTTPLYALSDPDDQYHQQAQTDLQQINEAKLSIILPYPIYLETHKLILQRLGIQQALQFARDIQQSTNLINARDDDYQAAVRLMERFPDQTITIFDAVTAILVQQMQVPVWTYDYHFDIMSVTVWRT